MEIYRREGINEELEFEMCKYVRIKNKEFLAEEVLYCLQQIWLKNDVKTINSDILEALYASRILIKTLGDKVRYRPIQDRFHTFYLEFIDQYWEDESIFEDDISFDDTIFEDDKIKPFRKIK